ncbi:MAG: HAMP domain-containing sensor histidine kinase [Alphaproteobacteria bacterium]
MDSPRQRLLPPKLLVAISIAITVIAAVALSAIHLKGEQDALAGPGADAPQTLVLELAVMASGFAAITALLFTVVWVGNHRLIMNYRQVRRLSHAMKTAAEADHVRSIFLADIGHELRTPLNSIIGISELMREETFGPMGNEQYKSYIDDIHQSGRHLLATISDILDLSRIQTGQTELHHKPLDLAECLLTTTGMLSSQPEAAALTFGFDFYPNLPPVLADQEAIRHVLQNVLANAIKYTLEGTITVWAHMGPGGGVEFGVTDTGIGIPPDELEKLTRRFNQIDDTWKRKFEGTGLGLDLVKALMERHDGGVTVESDIGVGTKVTCRLPRGRILDASMTRSSAA